MPQTSGFASEWTHRKATGPRFKFETVFRNKVCSGDDRSEVDEVVSEKIESILETGLNCNILNDKEDDTVEERDYKIL
jgi:hypothetical protein